MEFFGNPSRKSKVRAIGIAELGKIVGDLPILTLNHITRIACIGEVMIELVTDDRASAQLNVAGDTYNTAVYLKRLLVDRKIEVSYVTALGLDGFSLRILDQMASEGLSCDLVERRDERVPGLYAISTDDEGERSFTYWRSQSAARTLFQTPCEVEFQSLMRFDLVYISGITLGILAPIIRQKLLRFLERYRAAGGLVAFDSNFRPQLWESHKQALQSIDDFWRACDIALPSMDDERALFGAETTDETFQRFASYGVTSGALKRAGEGPQLLYHTQPDENFSSVARVVDTTAAGDSFNAGFLASLIAGHTEHHAAANGHAIASEVIQKKGAIVELPKKKWL